MDEPYKSCLASLNCFDMELYADELNEFGLEPEHDRPYLESCLEYILETTILQLYPLEVSYI